ncbi:MAG: Fur family transcriptional regulator [Oscillospiraceae bacterium]|nr:Fur family transcriptional regulator [Oscillospiraceae bacterium]
MSGYKTAQRRRLMDFLQNNPDKQFSAQQIAANLPAPEISLSAIYRNLSVLESAGLINRFVKEGSREVYYQYTQAERCRNRIHLICTKCGKTLHAEPAMADRLQSEALTSAGFRVDRSKTVLYGLCKDCQDK